MKNGTVRRWYRVTPKTRRGYQPEDERFFSPSSMAFLRKVQSEFQWLLDHDYPIDSSLAFVGNRYRLSARQRIAMKRASATSVQYMHRADKRLDYDCVRDGCLHIDGFNLIIPLEVALSGSLLILGKDDVIRDLAGLRGTYRIIDKTQTALDLIGRTLVEYEAPELKFYLDAPVSNSGRLRQKILETAEQWGIPTEVLLVPNADKVIGGMERVVTGDSIILDSCISWFNLTKKIVDDYIPDAWIVEF